MKRFYLPAAILALLFIAALIAGAASQGNRTYEHAKERAGAYALAINEEYKTPEKIYAFLCSDFKAKMSEKEFCEAFRKERSYPYITPLYLLSDPEVTLLEGGLKGTVIYKQAARIVGMTYEIGLVYENGDYYIDDWRDFPDGTYLKKFENIPYSLDWYY